MKKEIARLGEVFKTNQGYDVKIVEYLDTLNIVVMFVDSGFKVKSSYYFLKKGSVKNPLHKSVCGVGFFGIGSNYSSINKSKVKSYTAWLAMINRCYNEKFLETRHSYKDAVVCEEWHNYQNFADWHKENWKPYMDSSWHLDKDILIKKSKVYSPETCCFVPREINSLFVGIKGTRTRLPLGVIKQKGLYLASGKVNGKNIPLGLHKTPEEAFNTYKVFKENRLKSTAEHWKEKIPEKVYQTMITYDIKPF